MGKCFSEILVLHNVEILSLFNTTLKPKQRGLYVSCIVTVSVTLWVTKIHSFSENLGKCVAYFQMSLTVKYFSNVHPSHLRNTQFFHPS